MIRPTDEQIARYILDLENALAEAPGAEVQTEAALFSAVHPWAQRVLDVSPDSIAVISGVGRSGDGWRADPEHAFSYAPLPEDLTKCPLFAALCLSCFPDPGPQDAMVFVSELDRKRWTADHEVSHPEGADWHFIDLPERPTDG